MQSAIILAVLTPLALVAAWPLKRLRPAVGRLAVVAPVPALLLATVGGDVAVDLPWLLIGGLWGLDLIGRVFLGFTAAAWLAAGIYARSYLAHDAARPRFELFHLLTMSGNLGVTVSLDVGSFLLFFTLTSFAAYGLITHRREASALEAGRIYMVLVVVGEVLLFWGILLAAQQAGTMRLDELAAGVAVSPQRNQITGLLLVGFGIKVGLMPLHMWLPLAHPAAPTPASAVLSGAIIKTGLLGWLRFLPLGVLSLPEWGAVCVAAGMAGAFLAVVIGVLQTEPKTVLAYSSVSQMGLVTVGIGVALMAPAAWEKILPALLLFALHHAIAKSSLFLGVGVAARARNRRQQWMVMVGLSLSALSLAGLPLTTGFAAKAALKYAAGSSPSLWAEMLAALLPATGLMTALLGARFLWLLWPRADATRGPRALGAKSDVADRPLLPTGVVVPWGVLTALGVVAFFFWRWRGVANDVWYSLAPDKLWQAMGPILLAGGILLVFRTFPAMTARLARITIPAGDLIVPLAWFVGWCRRAGNEWVINRLRAAAAKPRRGMRWLLGPATQRRLERIALLLESDLSAGLLIGVLAVLVFALLMR